MMGVQDGFALFAADTGHSHGMPFAGDAPPAGTHLRECCAKKERVDSTRVVKPCDETNEASISRRLRTLMMVRRKEVLWDAHG